MCFAIAFTSPDNPATFKRTARFRHNGALTFGVVIATEVDNDPVVCPIKAVRQARIGE
jgi:hypothetical protein